MRPLLLLLATAPTWLAAQPQPDRYWPLDESSGTVAHDQTGQSDGTVVGATHWLPTDGYHGGALQFAGNDARVDLGPCDLTSGPGDQFSMACWFRPDIVSGNERVLVAKTLGTEESDFIWSLSLVNNTGARFRINTAGTVHTVDVPSSSIFSNAWYHLAAVYDGTAIRIYINGSSVASGSASGTIGFHPEVSATLGNLFDSQRAFFGSMDDVRLYSTALSHAQVVDLVINDVNTGLAPVAAEVRVANGELLLPGPGWRSMRISDLSGREEAANAMNEGNLTAALPDLPTGVYLVCLQGRDGVLARRVFLP